MKVIFLSMLLVFCCSPVDAQKDTVFIYFPFNSSQLNVEARNELQSFLELFQSQPAKLSIFGHCDSIGSHEFNDRLSMERTKSVRQWLERNGVGGEHISIDRGWGKRNPLNNNSGERERSLNRRVEIVLDLMEAQPGPDSVKIFSKQTLESSKPGEKLVLPQINFQGGLHRLLPSSLPSLEELLRMMKYYPSLEIEIQGHICCRQGIDLDGIDLETNLNNLSESRAKAVYDYLAENGIDKKRMRFKGLAGKYPIVWPEQTAEDRTRNRRVEMVILKK